MVSSLTATQLLEALGSGGLPSRGGRAEARAREPGGVGLDAGASGRDLQEQGAVTILGALYYRDYLGI